MHGSLPSGVAAGVAATLGRYVGSATADADPVEASLWLVVVASVVLDVYTTSVGLSAGLVEANPVMHRVVDAVGVPGLALAKLLVLGCAGVVREAWPRYGPTIALGLAVPWVLAVLVNVATLATL